jgi:hypothetical protein
MLTRIARLACALGLPLLGSLTAPSTAHANVRQVTPGTSCQYEDEIIRAGYNPHDGDTFGSHYSWLGAFHFTPVGYGRDGLGSAGVTCTVPRNLPLSTAGLSDLEIRFRNWSESQEPKQVKCYAMSVRRDFSIALLTDMTVTIPASPDKTTITGATIDFGNRINVSDSKGFYSVFCDLPRNVYLVSIYSSEVDGIDGN